MDAATKLKWPKIWRNTALIAFCMFIAFGMLAIIGPVSFVITTSTWTQAGLPLLAMAIAIYVPNRIASKERRRLAQESYFHARSLAFVLRPSVQSLIGRVDSSRRRWKLCPERYDDTEVAHPLEIPQSLSENLLELKVLGPAGIAIQHAIIAVQDLRTGIFTDYANLVQGGVYIDSDDDEEIALPDVDIQELLKQADAKLNHALRELDSLLER